MTGGIGREHLTNFYRNHFIFSNPRDTKNDLISRTVGIDRVVDEFIMTLTHDSEIDWLYVILSFSVQVPSSNFTNEPLTESLASRLQAVNWKSLSRPLSTSVGTDYTTSILPGTRLQFSCNSVSYRNICHSRTHFQTVRRRGQGRALKSRCPWEGWRRRLRCEIRMRCHRICYSREMLERFRSIWVSHLS